MRIGIGYDSHRLVEGRRLVLGGIDVLFEKGLLGHSDGDVLCHAIIDALIGALGEGDIGKHFPDTDARWKDASSILLLKHIVEMVKSKGFEIVWIDSVILAEQPKLAHCMDSMKDAISQSGIPKSVINIKAKTNEGMGFIGRGEGIAAQAVCLLKKIER
ncbi:MAG: 2-C-methyl-D-erythritol 2,4-cyclodiphosphate synthase [Nitrospirae bacterium]|nr:2-C-methyl-D-erythritol 2,4-cyclodiphosphate synthase [Nitrospirota bacterium]